MELTWVFRNSKSLGEITFVAVAGGKDTAFHTNVKYNVEGFRQFQKFKELRNMVVCSLQTAVSKKGIDFGSLEEADAKLLASLTKKIELSKSVSTKPNQKMKTRQNWSFNLIKKKNTTL